MDWKTGFFIATVITIIMIRFFMFVPINTHTVDYNLNYTILNAPGVVLSATNASNKTLKSLKTEFGYGLVTRFDAPPKRLVLAEYSIPGKLTIYLYRDKYNKYKWEPTAEGLKQLEMLNSNYKNYEQLTQKTLSALGYADTKPNVYDHAVFTENMKVSNFGEAVTKACNRHLAFTCLDKFDLTFVAVLSLDAKGIAKIHETNRNTVIIGNSVDAVDSEEIPNQMFTQLFIVSSQIRQVEVQSPVTVKTDYHLQTLITLGRIAHFALNANDNSEAFIGDMRQLAWTKMPKLHTYVINFNGRVKSIFADFIRIVNEQINTLHFKMEGVFF